MAVARDRYPLLSTALRERENCGHELRGIGRLPDVHLKSAFQCAHAILRSRVRGQRNGGCSAKDRLRMAPDPSNHFEAIEIRQPDVGNQNIGSQNRQLVQRPDG